MFNVTLSRASRDVRLFFFALYEELFALFQSLECL